MTDSRDIKRLETGIEAGYFVKGLSDNISSLRNLFEIFTGYGITFGDTNHLSVDSEIYKSLLAYSAIDPGGFTANIDRYKKELSDCFVKAEAYKVLDLTKHGFVAMIVDNKSEIIYEKAEGKGNNMLDWVLNNFLASDVYERTKRLKIICEQKLK